MASHEALEAKAISPIHSKIQEAANHDEAFKFLDGKEDITWTEEEERKVLRKIDFRLIPLMFFAGFITYMDGQAFGTSAIFGIIQDLGLYDVISTNPLVKSTIKYSWASSIPAFGSAISQFPLLFLFQFLPIGKVAGGIVAYSGFFALMMVVVKDFTGTMVVRFLYGFQVVGIPINVIITSMWWRNDEQALRVALWYAGAPFGMLLGQAASYGVVQISAGAFKDEPWRWIYVLMGSLTILYSIVFLCLFPDSPMTAKFLSERERMIAVQRLKKNHTGISSKKFKKDHVIDTLKDPQLYLMAMIKFGVAFINQCFGSFAGLLLTSFGFPTLRSITLLMPASGVIIAVMILSGLVVTRFKHTRILVAAIFLVPSIIGYVLLWKLQRTNQSGYLGALYISVFFYGAYIQETALVSSNIAGHTKKTTVNAIVSTVAWLGAIAGPFAFKGEEAKQGYPSGMKTVLAFLVITEACLGLLWLHYKRMNQQKVSFAEGALESETYINTDFADLTDRQNPNFRYST